VFTSVTGHITFHNNNLILRSNNLPCKAPEQASLTRLADGVGTRQQAGRSIACMHLVWDPHERVCPTTPSEVRAISHGVIPHARTSRSLQLVLLLRTGTDDAQYKWSRTELLSDTTQESPIRARLVGWQRLGPDHLIQSDPSAVRQRGIGQRRRRPARR
jgi:hypothetical protein